MLVQLISGLDLSAISYHHAIMHPSLGDSDYSQILILIPILHGWLTVEC